MSVYNMRQRLSAFLDISTYCNAACPQCHRTNRKDLDKVNWLPLSFWDLDKFKRAYPPEDVYRHYEFIFCGTWGDPVMNPHLDKILDYTRYHAAPKMNMIVNTNGSIRDEDWWYKLGLRHGKRLTVVFAIDGSTQEMHEKYRKKTSLQKILNNMEALSDTESKSEAMTIVFKHNEDYLADIAMLAREHGARQYSWVCSNRFDGTTTEWIYTENGEEKFLERTTMEDFMNNYASDEYKDEVITKEKKLMNLFKMVPHEFLTTGEHKESFRIKLL